MALKSIVGGLGRGKVILAADFVIEVFQERSERSGEVGYYYGLRDDARMVGVVDGGAGFETPCYERWQGKSGAFLSARAVSGALRDWFVTGEGTLEDAEAAGRLRVRAVHYLGICKEACGAATADGALSQELPASCALIVCRETEGCSEALSIWAGDARCYLMDERGLHQLSRDDVRGLDAMESLINRATPHNVVNAAGGFVLHAHVVPLLGPCVLFASTDGCFDGLQTPMEFEYLLLRTLVGAGSPIDWEDRLRAAMADVAVGDATLCGLSVGYGDFTALKEAFRPRMQELYEGFVRGIDHKAVDAKWALWDQYKGGYYDLAPAE